LCTLVTTIVIRYQKFEKFWYEGRALAESVKTLTWRFMTKSESFETEDSTLHKVFINRITEVKDEFSELIPEMNSQKLNLPSITEKMLLVRKSSLSDRIKFYRDNRIQNQIDWYGSKATLNKRLSNQYFVLLIAAQVGAIIASVYIIAKPETDFNFVGILTTLAAAFLTWIQVKKYNELNTAYSTTNVELIRARDTMLTIKDEHSFAQFVLDAENAVSREHTTWLAQRR
jgi:hypothetical protein